jgi:hypothetical protein
MEAFFIRSDIVIDLTAVGSAQTDNSPSLISINEDNKEESVSNRSQSNDSQLSVISSIIDPCQCSIPIKLSSSSQGDAVLAEVGSVLFWIEVDVHALA